MVFWNCCTWCIGQTWWARWEVRRRGFANCWCIRFCVWTGFCFGRLHTQPGFILVGARGEWVVRLLTSGGDLHVSFCSFPPFLLLLGDVDVVAVFLWRSDFGWMKGRHLIFDWWWCLSHCDLLPSLWAFSLALGW